MFLLKWFLVSWAKFNENKENFGPFSCTEMMKNHSQDPLQIRAEVMSLIENYPDWKH